MELWKNFQIVNWLLLLAVLEIPVSNGGPGRGWNRGSGGNGGYRGNGGGYRPGGSGGNRYGNRINYYQGNMGNNWNNGGGGGYGNFPNNNNQYNNHNHGGGQEQGQGQWDSTPENQYEYESTGCTPPDETELGGIFEVEGCSKQSMQTNWNECNAMKTNVPVGKIGKLSCTRAKKVLMFTTACQNTGKWSPEIPTSCIEVFLLSETQGSNNNDNAYSPSQNSNLNPKTPLQSTIILKNQEPCPKPKIQFMKNEEMKYEIICSKSTTIIRNCLEANNIKEFPHDSIITFTCKSPFVGLTSNSAALKCNNGRWFGGNRLKDFECELPQIDEKQDEDETELTGTGTVNNIPQLRPIFPTSSSPEVEQLIPIIPSVTPTQAPRPSPIYKPPPSEIPTTPTSTSTSSSNREIFCTPIQKTAGMKLECVYSKDDTTITNKCDKPKILPGTEARLSCEDHYEPSVGIQSVFRKCRDDGTWSAESTTFQCIVECGKENVIKKAFISHSLPTLRGQFPWHGGIYYNKGNGNESWVNACGGTLITRKAFLTASHCVTNFQESQAIPESSIRVHLGQYNRSLHDSIVQIKEIKKIIVHKNYDPYTFESDIAILIFKKEVDIGYYVRPICFPQTMDSALEDVMLKENSTGTVVGWGLNEFKKYSEDLRMTRLRIAGISECSDKLVVSSQSLRSTIYCATAKNSSVCEGDSGGGMYFPTKEGKDESNRWYIQGLVSFGIANDDGSGICDPSQFSAFTRVGRYADFISRTLSEYDAL